MQFTFIEIDTGPLDKLNALEMLQDTHHAPRAILMIRKLWQGPIGVYPEIPYSICFWGVFESALTLGGSAENFLA